MRNTFPRMILAKHRISFEIDMGSFFRGDYSTGKYVRANNPAAPLLNSTLPNAPLRFNEFKQRYDKYVCVGSKVTYHVHYCASGRNVHSPYYLLYGGTFREGDAPVDETRIIMNARYRKKYLHPNTVNTVATIASQSATTWAASSFNDSTTYKTTKLSLRWGARRFFREAPLSMDGLEIDTSPATISGLAAPDPAVFYHAGIGYRNDSGAYITGVVRCFVTYYVLWKTPKAQILIDPTT